MTTDLIRSAVNGKLEEEGITWATLETLAIDKVQKIVRADVALEGEPAPVEVTARYVLGSDAVQVASFDASRAWVAGALGYALGKHGGRIPLPGGMQGTVLRMLL